MPPARFFHNMGLASVIAGVILLLLAKLRGVA